MEIKETKKGRPRTHAEDCENVTYRLPKSIIQRIREFGGGKWIIKKVEEEICQRSQQSRN